MRRRGYSTTQNTGSPPTASHKRKMKFEIIVNGTVKTYTSYTEARKVFADHLRHRRDRPTMRAIDEQGNIMVYNAEQGAFFPVYNKQ